MPKFDADTCFEPIEIRMEGMDYRIEKITEADLDAIAGFAKKEDVDGSILDQQLAMILHAEPGQFHNVDIRRKTRVINFIKKTVMEQMHGKDAGGNDGGNAPQPMA